MVQILLMLKVHSHRILRLNIFSVVFIYTNKYDILHPNSDILYPT